jgi:nucleotide-binding universal stress UspA family protein
MGTKGATGLKEVFLGTLTQKIINSSRFPVLAIPQDSRYISLKKILFLTDYSLSQLHTLQKVHDLAHLWGAQIDVLQVSVTDNDQDKTFSGAWQKVRPKSDVHFYLLTSNDVEGTINDFIELHKINLVALVTHHYSFFEKLFLHSLSKDLVFHAQIPILSLSVDSK